MESHNPSSEPQNLTPENAPEQAPAAPAKPASDPRKGLPPIARAEVIGSEGGGGRPEGGRRFGGGDRGGPGGGRGPRRGPGGGGDNQEKAPNTRHTLMAVTDEMKSDAGALDDPNLAAEIEAMMNDVQVEAPKGRGPGGRPSRAEQHAVKPIGGARPAALRGPRKVESGREHRKGKVVSVGPTDIFIEFGPKELGVLPRVQFKEGDELPIPGAEFEVVVDRFETAESLFICSRPGTVQKADWEMLEPGQIVEARVTGVNKGGLELEVCKHRAFMPAGQVSSDRIADLSVLIGEKFPCEVVKVDRHGLGNIVLSRRNILAQERKEKAAKLKETLAEGQVLEGTVRKIMPFGAFIDIGGMDGLCHISDMTYDRATPSEKNVARYVKEGEHVKVQVLKLDLEGNKISLGMKQLAADPFVSATSEVTEGATVNGRVVRLTEFGAFVEIGPGVDGLVHVSEIARKRINLPADVLKQDQVVTAKVLKIDRETRKISLSIKALLAEEPPAPGSREFRNAEKNAERAKRDAERLAEIAKETPALRREREKFRNKQLSGGFGQKADFMGKGLGDLKL